ncbi:MAG: hypothetical protein OCD02_19290 [Spirochaetaceae bacterium]
MTLKTKNTILNFGTAINSMVLVLLSTLICIYPVLWNAQQLVILIITLIVLVLSIIIQVFYKKSLTSEIIFFVVFLSSLSIQSIRIIEPIFRSETFMVMLIIARTCIFFKYFALLSLLGASLFSFSFKKQKIGSWLLISLLVSLILSLFIHFNTGTIQQNMLPKIIYNKEEFILTLTVSVITTATFFKNAFDAKNREYIYIGISSTVLTLSLILSFISLNILTGIIMCLLLIFGSIVYLKSIHTITLWS